MKFIIQKPKDFQFVCNHLKKIFFNKKGSILIFLNGPFGVGKTAFIQEFAKFLNLKVQITSSSFILYNIYSLSSKNLFIHADFYKLDFTNEYLVSEIFEYFTEDQKNIIVLEWANKYQKYSDFILNSAINIFIDFQSSQSSTRICKVF